MIPTSTSPAAPTPCRTCGAPLPPGSDRCARCGTLHGAFRRCDGCGANAEVIRGSGEVFVCAACGRPRVPLEDGRVVRSGREKPALARVATAQTSRLLARGGAILSIVGSVILALVAAGAWAIDATGLMLAMLVAAGCLIAVAVAAFARAAVAQRTANAAMREAIGLVALDVMAVRGSLSPHVLAETMGIPEPIAESALASLPARTDVRVDAVVDDAALDGQLHYRVVESASLLDQQAIARAAEEEQADFDARLAASAKASAASNDATRNDRNDRNAGTRPRT